MESGLIKLNPQLMSLLQNNNGGQDIIPFNQEIRRIWEKYLVMNDNVIDYLSDSKDRVQ